MIKVLSIFTLSIVRKYILRGVFLVLCTKLQITKQFIW